MQISTETNFDRIVKEEWDAIVSQNSSSTIFQTYAWHKAWWEIFCKDKSLFLVVASENDTLVGILPLMIIQKGKRRILKFIGTGHSDYCDFIYSSNRLDVLEKLVEYLLENKKSWDEIALDYIPENSKAPRVLSQRCSSYKLYFHGYSQIACPVLIIDQDHENVKKILERKSLNKYYKYFFKKGGYEVLHLTEREEIMPYLDGFFDQHIRRRSETETPSLFLSEQNKEFYRSLLTSLCPDKQILFSVVKSQMKPIAFHFGFVMNHKFLLYKPTFDIDVGSYSPGKVLLKELFEHAIACGYQEFDFSIGKEAYKMEFANEVRRNGSVKILKTPLDYWASQMIAFVRGKTP